MSDFGGRMVEALVWAGFTEGGRVTQIQVGKRVAAYLKEDVQTAANISRHFSGEQIPSIAQVEAYADAMHVDPGWLGFGEKSEAKGPPVPASRLAEQAPRSRKGRKQA